MDARYRNAAEPSIPPLLLAAVRIVGASRIISAPVRRRLALCGIPWDMIEPVLRGVRTIDGWTKAFAVAADSEERSGNFANASAFAYLGQLPLSPHNPSKTILREQFRRCHVKHRDCQREIRFERLLLAGGRIAAYRETPVLQNPRDRPTIVLLPPLASTKEELTLLADPLLQAGFTVIRMDLPGQGESPAPLRGDSEKMIAAALDGLGSSLDSGVVAGGISLGAHYALRLAAHTPERVQGVFGVSPMAVRTEAQWNSLHEIIYQYLDIYFETASRVETRRVSRQMTLEPDVADFIRCPVRLFHAANDPMAQVGAPQVYRDLLRNAVLSERTVADSHGCLLHLAEFGRELGAWCEGLRHYATNILSEKPAC